MTKQRKNWKGCCQLCGRRRCNGAKGTTWNVMRKLGKKRRFDNVRLDEIRPSE